MIGCPAGIASIALCFDVDRTAEWYIVGLSSTTGLHTCGSVHIRRGLYSTSKGSQLATLQRH